jgi:hypothetical protein
MDRGPCVGERMRRKMRHVPLGGRGEGKLKSKWLLTRFYLGNAHA